MKIIRAKVEAPFSAHVYMNDEKNGKAEVTAFQFSEYIRALEVVERFESAVDKQYGQLT